MDEFCKGNVTTCAHTRCGSLKTINYKTSPIQRLFKPKILCTAYMSKLASLQYLFQLDDI